MKKQMKIPERLAALIDVKSIVTLCMTAALIALLFSRNEPSREICALYCTSYGAIVTYFFTRRRDGAEDKNGNT